MPIDLRWTTDPTDVPQIARTRLHCYKSAETFGEEMLKMTADNLSSGACEILLANDGREDVGTVTSWALDMVCRGGTVPCQGVAWVGTIKTARRRAGEGVATNLMNATLARARERGRVVSALMPFRASFYEHFGYGLAERRCDWTVPLSILPRGTSDGFAFATPDDHDAMHACRWRQTSAGQCDIQRSASGWKWFHAIDEPGALTIIDRPDPAGPVHGWLWLKQLQKDGKDILHVADGSWDSPEALLRQLGYLSTLRDQYFAVVLPLPAGVPLNRLLTESQVPHRLVNHAVAEPRFYTRMQVRILDHARYLQALHWPEEALGVVTVAVRECEGTTSTFRLDVTDGRATVTPASGEADVTCSDHVWASVATGDVPASSAARFGLLQASAPGAALLDFLSAGPTPYSNEYF